ncbi:MAG TPA: hypothetical protein VFV75_21080 [Candidatus Polarisedimenticolaceae bacterium]|nr:hypothetical protein [Candidatus Polarisedimenticolaceae bacterium]
MSEPSARSRGGTYPVRRGAPLSFEEIDRPRPAAGARAVRLRLGPLHLELHGLDDGRAGELRARYGPYAIEPEDGSPEALQVSVRLAARPYFIDPPERPEFNPVFLAYEAGRVRYLGYKVAGWFDPSGGRGVLVLAQGTYEPDLRAFENYIRAAVAWQAARRGGALVHAASAVLAGRAYLFYGQSGAGKSTLSACNRRARVVSDDLSLVLPGEGGRPELVGSPFRGTYEEGEPVLGSFPLAAGFRLVQDTEAAVRRVPRSRAMAELVGNLTFVAEEYARAPELWEALERTFRHVPLAHLHFRKDDSYWDAIARMEEET